MFMLNTFVWKGDDLLTWEIDLDLSVSALLKTRMMLIQPGNDRFTTNDAQTSRLDWPEHVVCKVRDRNMGDCGALSSVPCFVVSDRLAGCLRREAGHQLQFLPVTLVTTRRKLITRGYSICVPLLRVDLPECGSDTPETPVLNAELVASNARVFFTNINPQLLHVDDALGQLINSGGFVGVEAMPWRCKSRLGRAPAVPDPVKPEVVFTKVPAKKAPTKLDQRNTAAAAFAREHDMLRLARAIEDGLVTLGTPATAAMIEQIERDLDVRLPNDYITTLKALGTFSFGGTEILGNGKANDRASNKVNSKASAKRASHPVVKLTREFRTHTAFSWPHTAVCIYNDDSGGCSFLDTARLDNGTCPVVTFDHELVRADGTPRFEAGARSFATFVEKRVKEAMG